MFRGALCHRKHGIWNMEHGICLFLVTDTIPIASLAGFASASSYQSGYMVEPPDGALLQRTMDGTQLSSASLLKATPVLRSVMASHLPATSQPSPVNASLLSQEAKYDGTVARTQPNGIPLTSPFYYG